MGESDMILYIDEILKFGKFYGVFVVIDIVKNIYLLGLWEMVLKSVKIILDIFYEIFEDIIDVCLLREEKND